MRTSACMLLAQMTPAAMLGATLQSRRQAALACCPSKPDASQRDGRRNLYHSQVNTMHPHHFHALQGGDVALRLLGLHICRAGFQCIWGARPTECSRCMCMGTSRDQYQVVSGERTGTYPPRDAASSSIQFGPTQWAKRPAALRNRLEHSSSASAQGCQ